MQRSNPFEVNKPNSEFMRELRTLLPSLLRVRHPPLHPDPSFRRGGGFAPSASELVAKLTL